LEAHAQSDHAGDELGFIEPNLNFERLTVDTIRVRLAAECKPVWGGAGDVCIDTPATVEPLRAAALALRAGLAAFSQRADR
jgi:hypothetical protein